MAADLAGAVGAAVQTLERSVERGDRIVGVGDERGQLLTLERYRRALGVMFVVGRVVCRGRDDVVERSLQRRDASDGPLALGENQRALG